jgi:hypothetical protein
MDDNTAVDRLVAPLQDQLDRRTQEEQRREKMITQTMLNTQLYELSAAGAGRVFVQQGGLWVLTDKDETKEEVKLKLRRLVQPDFK